MTFFSHLESRIADVNSLLCVGLDPHPGDLPELTGPAAKKFCLRIIDATFELAAAYKPNIAFFEALGPDGITALIEVISLIPDEIPVIIDAKRGDIASTAKAYVKSVFETLGADAVTINPYLGSDSVATFIADPNKGVFVLCKTSNPGAEDLQDLLVTSSFNGKLTSLPLFKHVARLVHNWNINDNLGLVVGATQPKSLALVRSVAPDTWILAPGIGAQGGDLNLALESGLRKDGLGMLIPVSRGISRSENPHQAATDIRDHINNNRINFQYQTAFRKKFALPDFLMSLADGLLDAGCIKFGNFILKSGVESPIYIDLRLLVGFPDLLSQVGIAYSRLLKNLQFDHLAALPYAALPIATAISLNLGCPMLYPRKEVKSYGTKAQIEGVYKAGQKTVVIDDLISTGGSKFEGIEKLQSAGLVVEDVVVLIDRSTDRAATLAAHGYKLHSVLNIEDLLAYYEQAEKVPVDLIFAAREYFGN
jgi:uridine monophosphate synthetase